MSNEWLRGHYQNNEYGYLSLNYKLNDKFDFQLRPSFTAYDMVNSEKLPYSADVYGRELRQGDYRRTGERSSTPMETFRQDIIKMRLPVSSTLPSSVAPQPGISPSPRTSPLPIT